MKNKSKIILALLIGSVFIGCYYDKSDVINPNAAFVGCDTTSVSYASTISPILSNHGCNVCHAGSAAAGGGIVLDNYTGVQTAVNAGQLVPAVRQDKSCTSCVPAYPAYEVMPKNNGPKLDDCSINKIIAWVNQGAKNN